MEDPVGGRFLVVVPAGDGKLESPELQATYALHVVALAAHGSAASIGVPDG
jgi:hypothetical protein